MGHLSIVPVTNHYGCCDEFLEYSVPDGDTHSRAICKKCGKIHYENPKIVAGVIPMIDSKILLCRRAIEPRSGFWTLPSGYMELNETLQQAALREAKEEAGISPIIDCLHTIYDLPHLGQVYFLFKLNLDATVVYSLYPILAI